MLITKKMLLAIGLIAALVGGGLGALITNSSQRTEAANDSYQNTQAANTGTTAEREVGNPSQFSTAPEQVAYREGFEEGYNSCASAALGTGTNRNVTRSNVVSNNYSTTRARRVSNSGSRNVYYDYEQPRPKGRSFWSKHRDKLTMAIGTGSGAAIGGLAGGKKGAGIGALVGLGGSALYTYKLRKRSPRY
ncbi:MAG TPA: hypothetical protein VFX97_03020 [Pyrinomonadaceae bacterium]|nr:hypothetical protein [Pyrinomonadaceae bacterium]